MGFEINSVVMVFESLSWLLLWRKRVMGEHG